VRLRAAHARSVCASQLARARDILARVAGGAIRLTSIGIVVGIAGAFAFAGLLGTLLYGVAPSDPRRPLLVSAVALRDGHS
jgi:hypothetical protein